MTTNVHISDDRIAAIDALRGLAVIVWIVADVALPVIFSFQPSVGTEIAVTQLSRSIWHGLTLFDHVLPAILTAMGAGLVFSDRRRNDRGDSMRERLMHILGRSSLLFLVGFICTGGFERAWPDVRIMGIMQRIAICYLVAASLNLLLRVRGLIIATVFLFMVHWALMACGEALGHESGNLAAVVDRLLLPGRAYFGDWDPEGILTTIPAIATTVIGVLVGHCLSSSTWNSSMKLLTLGASGAVAVANGVILSDYVPINVYLWTSSFVMVTSGVLSLAIAGLYWLVDIRRCQAWVVTPVVAGRNALALVVLTSVMRFDMIAGRLVGGDIAEVLVSGGPFLRVVVQLVLICWLAFWLYDRRLFLTV